MKYIRWHWIAGWVLMAICIGSFIAGNVWYATFGSMTVIGSIGDVFWMLAFGTLVLIPMAFDLATMDGR